MRKQKIDEKFMLLAMIEARKGLGRTAPNPAVGAIIVRNGCVVAHGYHAAAGRPHAEIAALRNLASRSLAQGATLYVTLEPCSTCGRTGACTEAIIKAGFSRVVYGTSDPNPCHAGRAHSLLIAAGIQVTTGVLDAQCALLNKHWNKWIATGLPYTIAKVAMSEDRCIVAPAGRRWVTSVAARRNAMRLRATCDAILVGGETLRADNPRLTIRGLSASAARAGGQPWRVVWTRTGNLPADAHLFTDEYRDRTMVFEGERTLREVLHCLGALGIQSVLIEGGTRTHEAAFCEALVDETVVYISPEKFGDKTLLQAAKGFQL